MHFLKRIKKFWHRHSDFPVAPKYPVEYSFTHKGVEYYKYQDTFNVPSSRALTALDAYKEFSMGADAEYLKMHYDKTKELIAEIRAAMTVRQGAPVDLPLIFDKVRECEKINNFLHERLTYLKTDELYLKLASVVYFSKKENPNIYDLAYNRKKIDLWKKDREVLDFFLSKPLKELTGFSRPSDIDSSTYSKIMDEADKYQRSILRSQNYSKDSKTEKSKS